MVEDAVMYPLPLKKRVCANGPGLIGNPNMSVTPVNVLDRRKQEEDCDQPR